MTIKIKELDDRQIEQEGIVRFYDQEIQAAISREEAELGKRGNLNASYEELRTYLTQKRKQEDDRLEQIKSERRVWWKSVTDHLYVDEKTLRLIEGSQKYDALPQPDASNGTE
jgi:hypothetical protein